MTTSLDRLNLLKRLLHEGRNSTQEELREELIREGYDVNQSTISRDLRKIGAIKFVDANGLTTYRLSEMASNSQVVVQSLVSLIVDIRHNDTMIVIQTTPGSASLVARHLDLNRPGNILGTIAGDDTIFVAPGMNGKIKQTIQSIKDSF